MYDHNHHFSLDKCGTDALISYLNMSDSFVIDTIPREMHELNYYNFNYDKGLQW